MINFSFGITLPIKWATKSVFYKHWYVTENKIFNIQLDRFDRFRIFGVIFEWSMKQDHAGLYLLIDLFGYTLSIDLHDKRHWDGENNTWFDEDRVLQECYGR